MPLNSVRDFHEDLTTRKVSSFKTPWTVSISQTKTAAAPRATLRHPSRRHRTLASRARCRASLAPPAPACQRWLPCAGADRSRAPRYELSMVIDPARAPLPLRTMAGRTIRREYVVAACRVARLCGRIGRWFVAAERSRLSPMVSHPSDKDVDLRFRKEASSVLSESGHRGSTRSPRNYAPDRGRVGKRRGRRDCLLQRLTLLAHRFHGTQSSSVCTTRGNR